MGNYFLLLSISAEPAGWMKPKMCFGMFFAFVLLCNEIELRKICGGDLKLMN